MKKKIISSEIRTIVDYKTGEVTEMESFSKRQIEREPDYVKIYLKDIIRIKDLPSGMEKVLLSFIKCMSYTNIILTYLPVKKIIAAELDISISYVNKCIDSFIKADIFLKMDRGIYLVDPELFGRGKWENIEKIRLSITYDFKTGKKEIKSDIKEQLKLDFNSNG
jgi:hypothetical protein